jgi:glycosyltransferase involved in cell wall biosynthesis
MRSSGIDSNYLVLHGTLNDRADIFTVTQVEPFIKRVLKKILKKTLKKIAAYSTMRGKPGLFSSFKDGVDISRHRAVLEADIIYIHWINSFVNYHILKKILKTGKPVFWFLHDMFAITGGCHYAFDCVNYQVQCVKCPYRETGADLSIRQYKIKQKLYQQFDNLAFIAPSKWLFDCAQTSGLTRNKRVYHIPNLIDTTVFKPVKKSAARRLFSLDIKKKIIGFGWHGMLKNPYKGWTYLRDALRILSKDTALQDTEVLIFGSGYSKETADDIPFPSYFLGNLHDEYSLVMAYGCMDVFVSSSLAENFPNTILESLACDTPVVGFNVGGIPDTVNANTGYLAEYKNSDDLAKGIALLLKKKKPYVSKYVTPFTGDSIVNRHKKCWELN